MTVDVILSAGEVALDRVKNKNVAVVDVFRATSVIVEALNNNAKSVVPVVTVEEALLMRQKFERDGVLLGGERNTVKIDGFDLDNSPLKYTEDVVGGKTIVFTTTNGTRAMNNARGATSVTVGSFLNLSAVCDALAQGGRDVVIICAGRSDRFTAEDGLCAGAMAGILASRYGFAMTDIAEVMQRMYADAAGDLQGRLETTAHYRDISARGYDDDIRFCLRRDIYNIVPIYTEKGEIVL